MLLPMAEALDTVKTDMLGQNTDAVLQHLMAGMELDSETKLGTVVDSENVQTIIAALDNVKKTSLDNVHDAMFDGAIARAQAMLEVFMQDEVQKAASGVTAAQADVSNKVPAWKTGLDDDAAFDQVLDHASKPGGLLSCSPNVMASAVKVFRKAPRVLRPCRVWACVACTPAALAM